MLTQGTQGDVRHQGQPRPIESLQIRMDPPSAHRLSRVLVVQVRVDFAVNRFLLTRLGNFDHLVRPFRNVIITRMTHSVVVVVHASHRATSPVRAEHPIPDRSGRAFNSLQVRLIASSQNVRGPFELCLTFVRLIQVFVCLLGVIAKEGRYHRER